MIVYISDPKFTREVLHPINTFSNVANDKWAKKEIKETSPFTIATNNIKYLGVTLTKQVKDLYD